MYWLPNLLFGTNLHPGEGIITAAFGTVIILVLVYAVILFTYGFLAYSFDLPRPFEKKE